MINFLNLEYFLVVAEEFNSTHVARKLYISQQSLNNHVSNPEEELDVILFNRTFPLTLTYAGRVLKTRARELLDLRDGTHKETSDTRDFSMEQFSIGVSHTYGGVILSEILPTYQSQFPGIELHLAEGDSSQLAPDLPHGSTDLMIDLPPFTAENMEIIPICSEETLMVVLDSILEKVYPNQVKEMEEKFRITSDTRISKHCPLILLKKGSRAHIIVDEIFEGAQMGPQIVLEVENIGTVLALNGKGMGIIFYPRMFVSPDPASCSYRSAILEQDHLDFHSLNYTQVHGVPRTGYHKGHHISRAAHEFIHIAKERLDYTLKK